MAQEKYVEGCYMQRPPFLEANMLFFWKTCFETYIKSKDIDLWQVIQNGDFVFEMEDPKTKLMMETSYELLEDDQKKTLGKKNEAKMTLYNALPRKDYERVFMCKTTKEVWHTLIITHQEGHFASECKKPKENKAFVEGAWSDSEDDNEPQNDATCLMEIGSQEVLPNPFISNNDLDIIDLQKENDELLTLSQDFLKHMKNFYKKNLL
nr:zf-CCHC domain-containing protein/DUF4219 domain-containing protein/UBN2 domain-containing protein [Tanacetum cinerariifolium]